MKKKIKLKVQMSNIDGIITRTISYPRTDKQIANDYEWILSLMQACDRKLMRMKVGDRTYFKSLRDEPNSLGIVTRIK